MPQRATGLGTGDVHARGLLAVSHKAPAGSLRADCARDRGPAAASSRGGMVCLCMHAHMCRTLPTGPTSWPQSQLPTGRTVRPLTWCAPLLDLPLQVVGLALLDLTLCCA